MTVTTNINYELTIKAVRTYSDNTGYERIDNCELVRMTFNKLDIPTIVGYLLNPEHSFASKLEEVKPNETL